MPGAFLLGSWGTVPPGLLREYDTWLFWRLVIVHYSSLLLFQGSQPHYIFQIPLQLGVAMWLSASQCTMNRSVPPSKCGLHSHFLSGWQEKQWFPGQPWEPRVKDIHKLEGNWVPDSCILVSEDVGNLIHHLEKDSLFKSTHILLFYWLTLLRHEGLSVANLVLSKAM